MISVARNECKKLDNITLTKLIESYDFLKRYSIFGTRKMQLFLLNIIKPYVQP